MTDTRKKFTISPRFSFAVSAGKVPRIIYILAFILAGTCVIAYAFLKYDVDSDIAKSYSYLAQEFSHGNWEHFCNPNLPLLMPFISGILTWALHIAPWRSCMLVSGIFYVCTLFPLHKLLRHLTKSNLPASLGCLLFVVAPQLLRFSCSGWLEAGENVFYRFKHIFNNKICW